MGGLTGVTGLVGAMGVEGGLTIHAPGGERMSIYDAAMKYRRENTPLVVLAGKEYGAGSSRDWAAKGPFLQGVKAVIAESFERIHRSNLVGMGVLPLQFKEGQSVESLGQMMSLVSTVSLELEALLRRLAAAEPALQRHRVRPPRRGLG